jgi:hypothetical protein
VSPIAGPTAPKFLEGEVVQDESVAQVPRGTEFEGGGVEGDAGGAHDVQCGVDDFGPNAVATHHGHAVRSLTAHSWALSLCSILVAQPSAEQTRGLFN